MGAQEQSAQQLKVFIDGVLAATGAKTAELFEQITSRLAGEMRVVLGTAHAFAVLAVTGGAGGNAALGITGLIDVLRRWHQRFVGDIGFDLLAGEIGAEVQHVLLRQRRRHAEHDRIHALAGLEQRQLLRDVLRMLSGNLRVLRVDTVAVNSMAGGAYGRLGLTGSGIATRRPDGIRGEQRRQRPQQPRLRAYPS